MKFKIIDVSTPLSFQSNWDVIWFEGKYRVKEKTLYNEFEVATNSNHFELLLFLSDLDKNRSPPSLLSPPPLFLGESARYTTATTTTYTFLGFKL